MEGAERSEELSWSMERGAVDRRSRSTGRSPIDLLVFVVVLVDDFFAIKLFHYHVPNVKKQKGTHIATLVDTWAISPLV